MPVCRDCRGTGQREIRKEITTRCPDCDGTKVLPDGSECERCNRWGEIGTGKFEIEIQLCKTCWGSGKVSEGSVMTWYLVRAVPATLLLLGGGIALAWVLWSLVENVLLTALVLILFFGVYGGLMYHFVRQTPGLGEISVTNWFLIRAIPTTLTAIGVGGPAAWASWVVSGMAAITFLIIIGVLAVWGVVMFFFISNLPE
jgi:hypothetical protein